MISLFAEPMPITHGRDGLDLLLLGVMEDDYGLKGLTVDRFGEMTLQRLSWPIKCDFRFDAKKDAWTEKESRPTDEEVASYPDMDYLVDEPIWEPAI